jgi:tetratricopeptide (TPR) repeat protein
MRCLHCGNEVSIFKKLSDAQFCSAEHRQHFYADQQRLMLERVQASASRLRKLRRAAAGEESATAAAEPAITPEAAEPAGSEDSSFRLGLMLLEKGDFRRSIEAFESCIGTRGDWPEAYLNLGAAHWRLKEYEPAITAFETVLTLDPNSLDALRSLAAIAIECEDFERALDLQAKLMQWGEKIPEPFAYAATQHYV